MINRNVADYTNFDGKTNKKITQSPGGASSLSLGWGHDNTDNQYHKPIGQKQNPYSKNHNDGYTEKPGNSLNRPNQSYDQPMGVMGHNYEQGFGKNGYEEQNTRLNSHKSISSNAPVGGEHGYNNYNPINHQQQQNSYQNYPPTSKYPPKQSGSEHKAQLYKQKQDPVSFYKPSSNQKQQEYDTALLQQKHQIQSSRSKRSQNTSNSQHQQANQQQGKPCVKIHQQKNNDIFGSQYDYWKQDGYSKNPGQVSKNEPQFMYEKAQHYKPTDQGIFVSEKNQKTSVKVHNPPGGKSNFIFG